MASTRHSAKKRKPSTAGQIRQMVERIGKAENDLKTAAQTLKLGTDCPTDTVCFHAQQCVEKCLKKITRRPCSR
jgi:HEPN domain-containing protein